MINNFENEYAFLSNFYESPIKFQGIIYPTNEHFFQAMKTLDPSIHLEIAQAPTPGKAKRLGRRVKLRPDWEEIKEDVMEEGLRLKFADPYLRKKLIDTAPEELVEGTTWHDQFWGICTCFKCKGQGRNRLGELLMELRDEYIEETHGTLNN